MGTTMTDASTEFVSRINSLSDVCKCCSFAAGEALAEIDYNKNRKQVDVISGAVAIIDQLGTELKNLSEQAENFTLHSEDDLYMG